MNGRATTGEFPQTRGAKATDLHLELIVGIMFGVSGVKGVEEEKRRQVKRVATPEPQHRTLGHSSVGMKVQNLQKISRCNVQPRLVITTIKSSRTS